MIEAIAKLEPETKKLVLTKLHQMGVRNGDYVRFTYNELKDVAHFLRENWSSLDQHQVTLFLNQFNQIETNLIRDFQNKTPEQLTTYQAQIKKQNTRTRLAVSRILKIIQQEQSEKSNPQSAFQKFRRLFV